MRRAPRARSAPANTDLSRSAVPTRRSHGRMSATRLGGTRKIRPCTHSTQSFGEPDTFSIFDRIWGSRFRTVTGSAGSALASMMPKRAGNLASGGNASILMVCGKRAALTGVRPASSARSAGTSRRSSVFSGNGPLKLSESVHGESAASKRGAHCRPSGPMSTTRRACSMAMAAENRTRTGVMGIQPAFLCSRSQSTRTVKGSRTLKCSDWSRSVATPLSAATLAPHRG